MNFLGIMVMQKEAFQLIYYKIFLLAIRTSQLQTLTTLKPNFVSSGYIIDKHLCYKILYKKIACKRLDFVAQNRHVVSQGSSTNTSKRLI